MLLTCYAAAEVQLRLAKLAAHECLGCCVPLPKTDLQLCAPGMCLRNGSQACVQPSMSTAKLLPGTDCWQGLMCCRSRPEGIGTASFAQATSSDSSRLPKRFKH